MDTIRRLDDRAIAISDSQVPIKERARDGEQPWRKATTASDMSTTTIGEEGAGPSRSEHCHVRKYIHTIILSAAALMAMTTAAIFFAEALASRIGKTGFFAGGTSEARPGDGNNSPVEPAEETQLTSGVQNIELFNALQLASHSDPDTDCWVVYHSSVYDMTGYALLHPGGSLDITDFCGTDATIPYEEIHTVQLLSLIKENLVGFYDTEAPTATPTSFPVASGNQTILTTVTTGRPKEALSPSPTTRPMASSPSLQPIASRPAISPVTTNPATPSIAFILATTPPNVTSAPTMIASSVRSPTVSPTAPRATTGMPSKDLPTSQPSIRTVSQTVKPSTESATSPQTRMPVTESLTGETPVPSTGTPTHVPTTESPTTVPTVLVTVPPTATAEKSTPIPSIFRNPPAPGTSLPTIDPSVEQQP